MKAHVIALALAGTSLLASCSTFGGSYDAADGAPRDASSFTYLEGTPQGKPQRSGWFTSPQIREAQKRSISEDIPYAVVKPVGTVVTD